MEVSHARRRRHPVDLYPYAGSTDSVSPLPVVEPG